ncbi:translation initiation factor IF-2 [Candidatus Phycosocius bacilliformis]|uniref:Translation initiation factor IF-2 n=1 Tax=Candidatus Phycosocius bacilliformis TaxID=1445552 RepID=A0A2P2EDT2_9PROT|nr:translation initiation factor IF-2 [Candidatus Phycosocius bacilliformis]GBF59217.1 translation initiation factor IF-2 [Candidatus Phycosocius bacilliformis]
MSDGNENDNPTGRKPLTLSRNVGAGTVRQSFSHGRTNQVVVEVKKKRIIGPGEAPAAGGAGAVPKPAFTPPTRPAAAPAAAPARPAAPEDPRQAQPRLTKTLGLSESEMKARQAALDRAREQEQARRLQQQAEAELRQRREEADRRRMEEERQLAEAEAQRRRQQEEEQRAAEARRAADLAETGARGREEPIARAPGRGEVEPTPTAAAAEIDEAPAAEEGEDGDLLSELGGRVKRQKAAVVRPPPVSRAKGAQQRRSGKLTITSALGDDSDRQRSLASVRRAREKERDRRMRMLRGQEQTKQVREVVVPEVITVAELANRMAERLTDVIKYLMKQGQMMKGADNLDADTAELIVTDFGHTVKRVAESDVEIGLEGEADTDANLQPRPAVVTIMGHVDHGKTSLLDAIRSTDTVKGEAGGITQHIGAYQVRLANGERITFLDTPGHAAFSSMRARGASVTDVVVLVVAADDGVMPQTVEAINHAKAAGVPMIVAVNKVDKPDANPQKVLNELLQYEVLTEAVGGDTLWVPVSAKERTNLDTLLETILLQSEILDLRANPDRAAEGAVIEAKLDKGRGAVATVLVQRGTLKRGDLVVAGTQWGRVRALMDERGQTLQSAGPSQPVEILGLDGAPEPGDVVVVVENEARAREVTDYRIRMKREKVVVRQTARSGLEAMLARIKDAEVKEFPLIVKADVGGSAEAITAALEKLSTDEVRAKVIHQAVGGITESDVLLAKSSGAPILAFNTRAQKQVRDLAEHEGVEIRYYSIIYNLLDDVKDILSGMLEPERKETFLGYAQILQVFNITKVGKIAGCKINEGNIRRGCGVRLLRDDVVIHEGKLSTLKRFKDEVSEVSAGQECGMAFEGYQDLREGDLIECFDVQIIKRSL